VTATELDVDRTLELARCAREPSSVDEQRVLDRLRSRIVDAPEQLGGRRVRRLHLVRILGEDAPTHKDEAPPMAGLLPGVRR